MAYNFNLTTDKKLIEHALFFRYLLLEKSTKYMKRNFLKRRQNEKGQNLMLDSFNIQKKQGLRTIIHFNFEG